MAAILRDSAEPRTGLSNSKDGAERTDPTRKAAPKGEISRKRALSCRLEWFQSRTFADLVAIGHVRERRPDRPSWSARSETFDQWRR
jgi:hypothetical protein